MKAIGDIKVCNSCKQEQNLCNFRSNKAMPDGLHSQCKKCDNAARTNRKRRNGDKWKERNPHYATVKIANLDKDHVQSLVNQHDRACDICGDKSAMHLDHCHSTNKIRGFLCRNCNFALGLMLDDPERLEAAARYLRG